MYHGDVFPEIAQGLLTLKKRIEAAKIPSSKLDETIPFAIWNLREFGWKPRIARPSTTRGSCENFVARMRDVK